MKTRRIWLGVLTLGLGVGLLGCEKWSKQALRQNQSDDGLVDRKKAEDAEPAINWGERSSVKSGAWSSEAREIESHFSQ